MDLGIDGRTAAVTASSADWGGRAPPRSPRKVLRVTMFCGRNQRESRMYRGLDQRRRHTRSSPMFRAPSATGFRVREAAEALGSIDIVRDRCRRSTDGRLRVNRTRRLRTCTRTQPVVGGGDVQGGGAVDASAALGSRRRSPRSQWSAIDDLILSNTTTCGARNRFSKRRAKLRPTA